MCQLWSHFGGLSTFWGPLFLLKPHGGARAISTGAPKTTHAWPGGWGMSEKEEQQSVLIKLNRPLAGHPAHQHRCLVRLFRVGWLDALSYQDGLAQASSILCVCALAF